MVVAESGKPSTSGKKPRKGATKKASKHVHSIIENASEEQFNKRTLIDQTGSQCHLLHVLAPLSHHIPLLQMCHNHLQHVLRQPRCVKIVPFYRVSLEMSGPVLTAMHSPFYNYGFQNQSMHYYWCSPPLIPSTTLLSPSGPRSAADHSRITITLPQQRPQASVEPRPGVTSVFCSWQHLKMQWVQRKNWSYG